jgi:hypothetical protein
MQHIQLDIWHTSQALFFKPDYMRVQQRLIGQLPSHNNYRVTSQWKDTCTVAITRHGTTYITFTLSDLLDCLIIQLYEQILASCYSMSAFINSVHTTV